MDKAGWRNLAKHRLADARTLLRAKRWAGAYYIAGYAVECGLKSCVLTYVERSGIIFDDPKFSSEVRTHNLEKLVQKADLQSELDAALGKNDIFRGYWENVQEWSEETRYELRSRIDAEQLYEAITHKPDGILLWIKTHW